jgi:hypothetical protein
MVYLPLIYSLGYPLITSSTYPMSNPDYPRFLHVPKGAMEQVAAGRSRKKPGPKKRQFSTPRTPKKTSNLSQDLMTESPTPSSNTVSSFDPPRESRAVYPPAPPPLPMPTIEPPTYLSQPDLFAPAIPPLSQSIIWTDGGVRTDSFTVPSNMKRRPTPTCSFLSGLNSTLLLLDSSLSTGSSAIQTFQTGTSTHSRRSNLTSSQFTLMALSVLLLCLSRSACSSLAPRLQGPPYSLFEEGSCRMDYTIGTTSR